MPRIWEISASGALTGTIRPQSDKSMTHRALMFGGSADGITTIHQPLMGDDCLATAECLKKLGVKIEESSDKLVVHGIRDWKSPSEPLDCGNSGTTARLLSGLLASQNVSATITGDASLTKRPMKRITEPLRQMGAGISSDLLPFSIKGGFIQPQKMISPVASAQVKSCLILASLRSKGTMIVQEPAASRDHTERLLTALGAKISSENNQISVQVPFEIPAFETTIPADISSAAFFLVASAVVPGSSITLLEVGVNPTRSGILDILEAVGVIIGIENPQEVMGEPKADLKIKSPEVLKPFVIEGDMVPRLVDEIPVLAVLATQCNGTTIIKDAAEVRVKESDRLHLMATALNQMGAHITETPEGLIIKGPTPLKGTQFDAHLDHRIAMSLAVAGLIASGTTTLTGIETVASSYPNFLEHLVSLQSKTSLVESTI